MNVLKVLWQRLTAAKANNLVIVPYALNNPQSGTLQQAQDIETVDTNGLFRNAPPELIRCIMLNDGIENVRDRSLEDVIAQMQTDPEVLGATFKITDQVGQEHMILVCRSGKICAMENGRERELSQSEIKQLGW